MPGSPSLWSGVRWRRRRAWKQLRSTSASYERSRAPTRPASGPRSGTPRAGAADGRARAGQGGRPLRGRVSGQPPAGPAPAPPFGEPGARPPPSARRVSIRSLTEGPFPEIAGSHSPVTLKAPPAAFLRAGAAFVLPPRLAGCCATIQCAGPMVVLSRSFPEDITLLPPCQTPSCPRHKSCSSDKTEFYPTACCSEIKL